MRYVVTLPYPISNNEYKKPRSIKGGGLMWYLTKEAQAYKTEVAWRIKAAGIRQPFPGRVCVGIQLYPQRPKDADKRAARDPMNWDDDVRCLDLDNARKVLLDAMIGIVYPDDKWIWRDWGERMEPDGEARVVVTIEQIVRVSPQAEFQLERSLVFAGVELRRMAEEKPF